MKKLLFQFDTDAVPSVFDVVVGYDGGADHITGYGNVTPDNVGALVDGTIYTRGGSEKKSTAIFVGGGKAHGPRVRSHAHELPKKVRALALKHALSSKAGSKTLFVLEDVALKDAKTKAARDALAKLGLTNALIIDGDAVDANFSLAARNVPHVDVLPAQGLNVYDVLKHDQLVLTKAAVEKIHARLGAGEAA